MTSIPAEPLSHDRYRQLVEAVQDYGIFMLDPQGHVMSWNAGAQRIKGFMADEIIGRHFSVFYPEAARAIQWPDEELRRAARDGTYEEEGWRVRKDGSTFWANVVITAVRAPDGTLTGFGKVTRDLTERRRLRELEHSARRMNEFIAMLAHELRNPLAPIRNAVSIMQLEPALSPTLRASRDMIDRQLSHLSRLVDDLLDAGRLTSGKIRIKPERVSFNQVAARAVEAARPQMDARQHRFVLDMPREEIHVNADETRLVQVIQNLLGNAAKFTPAGGGEITLRARVAGTQLRVEVQDNGVGLPQGATDSIFELFSQGDGVAASREAGLGIGLSLARSLVEMHDGRMGARSDGPGRGSVFHFELPNATLGTTQGDPAADGAADGDPWVLVVDDNRDAADSLAEILRLMGRRVRTAYDGAAAIEAARIDAPGLVLLDMSMPGMNGPQVLAALRRLPAGDDAFVVAISGYGVEDEKAGRADFRGFDGHLQKPVDLAALQGLLDARRTRAGLRAG